MSNSMLKVGGKFRIEHRNVDGKLIGVYDFPNGIVDVGLNHILNTQFYDGPQSSEWYMGLIDNANYSALSNADEMDSHAGWQENDDYTQATRPQWEPDEATGRQITNPVTVDFSINDTAALRGIFIVNDNTKNGTAGVLWATALFASVVSVQNGDTLKVTYTVSG